MKALLGNAKFWLAVAGVVQSILFYYFTSVPESIWLSIDVLIGVVIASLTADEIIVAVKMLNERMADVSSQLSKMKK